MGVVKTLDVYESYFFFLRYIRSRWTTDSLESHVWRCLAEGSADQCLPTSTAAFPAVPGFDVPHDTGDA